MPKPHLLFIKDSKALLLVFRLAVVVMVFPQRGASFDFVWNLAGCAPGLMALVNIIVILRLGGLAIRVRDDYTRQKKAGRDPVFHAKDVGLNNTQQWK